MKEEWVLSIREQCEAAGVAFFFKQWGGTRKKAAGRTLNGRTYDEFPIKVQHPTAPASVRLQHAAEIENGLSHAARTRLDTNAGNGWPIECTRQSNCYQQPLPLSRVPRPNRPRASQHSNRRPINSATPASFVKSRAVEFQPPAHPNSFLFYSLTTNH